MERDYDMDIVPLQLFIDFTKQKHGLLCSRFGRLLLNSSKNSKVVSKWKPGVRANAIQSYSSKDQVKLVSNMEPALRSRPHNVVKQTTCYCCDLVGHVIGRCGMFLEKGTADRKSLANQKRLCYNCLGKDHGVRDCTSELVQMSFMR